MASHRIKGAARSANFRITTPTAGQPCWLTTRNWTWPKQLTLPWLRMALGSRVVSSSNPLRMTKRTGLLPCRLGQTSGWERRHRAKCDLENIILLRILLDPASTMLFPRYPRNTQPSHWLLGQVHIRLSQFLRWSNRRAERWSMELTRAFLSELRNSSTMVYKCRKSPTIKTPLVANC